MNYVGNGTLSCVFRPRGFLFLQIFHEFSLKWSIKSNNKIYESHFESVPTNRTCLWRFGLFVRFEVEIPNRFLSWIGLPIVMVREFIFRHILLTSYIRLILYVTWLTHITWPVYIIWPMEDPSHGSFIDIWYYSLVHDELMEWTNNRSSRVTYKMHSDLISFQHSMIEFLSHNSMTVINLSPTLTVTMESWRIEQLIEKK